MQIANRIRELCEKNNLTGVELGRLLNLRKSPLTDWKNGKASPTLEHILIICDNFAVSPDYLLTGKEPLPPGVAPDEMELLKKLRALPPEKRQTVETLLNQL